MAFPGLQHVAITVSDLERSTQWYSRLLGAEPVLDEDEESGTFHHTVFLLDGGQLFGLHTHMGNESGDAFDERRTGSTTWASHCRARPSSSSGATASTSWGSPRRHQEGRLWQRTLVPRSRQHRPGVLHRPGT